MTKQQESLQFCSASLVNIGLFFEAYSSKAKHPAAISTVSALHVVVLQAVLKLIVGIKSIPLSLISS